MGERSYLSIGDVLALLREEFPDITISKIRFLESRGLLVPERTPSGYRKFYDHDVERLRWILRQQREHFLPLKVIKGRLEGAEGASQPESLFDPAEPAPDELARDSRPGLSAIGSGAANGTHPSAGARAVAETHSAGEVAAGDQPREAAAGARVATMAPVRHQPVTELASRRQLQGGNPIPGPGTEHTATLGDEHGARADSGQGDPLAAAAGTGRGGADATANRGVAPPGPAAASSQTPGESAGRGKAGGASEAGGAGAAGGTAGATTAHEIGGDASPRRDTTPSRPPGESAGRASNQHAPPGRPSRQAAAASGTSLVDAVMSGASLTAAELAQASGLRVDLVEELESFGLIEGRDVAGVHCFDEEALVLASLAAAFGKYGIEARHLRIFKHAAERQTSLYSQVVMPLLRQRNPAARSRAHEDLQKMAELGTSLQACFSRAVLRDLTGG